MKIIVKTVLATGTFITISAGLSLAETYSITDLGAVGRTSSISAGHDKLPGTDEASKKSLITDLGLSTTFLGLQMNNRGQIMAGSTDDTSIFRTYIYNKGEKTEIGTLGGRYTSGKAINDAGQITGGAAVDPEPVAHAFIYSNGVISDIGTLGGYYSTGNAINSAGEVTGYSTLTQYDSIESRAFLYSQGKMINLGTLGGPTSTGLAINNRGQVTGWSTLDYNKGDYHAFLYDKGKMIDLGSLNNTRFSYGNGINNAGEVVGGSTIDYSSQTTHAFLYSKGKMIDLGTPGTPHSVAKAINNSGTIVGDGFYGPAAWGTAFIYKGGVMTDLNKLLPTNSGWHLTSATGINNLGEITGFGLLNGVFHAYIMKPNKQPKHQ